MADTIAFYEGDGVTTDFTVPFDYLKKEFVKVYYNDTELEGGDYGDPSVDFYFLDNTTVRCKTPADVGVSVSIRRYTSATERVISFKDASILKASDLDTSAVQTLHIAEEGRDLLSDTLTKTDEGIWDGKGHKFGNVADPENPQDVATKNYVDRVTDKLKTLKEYEEITKGYRDESETFRDESLENAVSARASAATAVESANHANSSKNLARQSEENAKASEEVAKEIEKRLVFIETIGGASGSEVYFSVDSEYPAGYEYTIPSEAFKYVVGKHHLQVCWNGLSLSLGVNFEEVGSVGSFSNKFRLLFKTRASDELKVYAGNLVNPDIVAQKV